MSRPKLSVVLPLLTVLAVPDDSAADLTPESRVAEVTVYRQAALVAREARVTLPPGVHRVILKDIPCVADPDSVRVSGTGSFDIEIGGVEVQQQFRQPDLTPEYRLAEKEMEDLARRQALVSARRAAIVTLREFLSGLKISGGQDASRDALTKGFAVESWQAAFDFFSTRLDALSEEERALDVKDKDLSQQIGVARGRLSQMTSQGGIQRWSAAVMVSSPRGGPMTLRASYLATHAAWRPLYDARLDPATEKVSLFWQSQVTQTTGEDWKDVAITLATTRPSAGIDLPALASLQLQTRIAQIGHGQGGFLGIIDGASSSLPVLGKDYQDVLSLAPGVTDMDGDGNLDIDRIPAAKEAKALAEHGTVRTAQAQSTRREIAVSFVLPGRLDIPSDGQPHKHLIASREMDARIEHRAVPLVVPAVYLVAKVTLPGEVPLLAGKVQHFVGGDLVGSSTMAERAAGEEFSLSFGPDDRLKAERKQLLKKVERRGKDDEIVYRFVTSIENHLGRDGVIELKDRIPVSGDGRVLVTLDDEETTSGAFTDEKEPGIMTWKVPVPKGGKGEVTLTYHVRAPRGMALAGLD